MIGFIERTLKRWGIIAPFDKDEILNAQADNKLHDYEVVAQEVRKETSKRRTGNDQLRRSLGDAKRRTNGFADFERLIQTHGDHRD